ncbi:MAG: HDOD domain-containing protein [Treponema sp.]|nr:HDOD domain-containing protein [Treponema sp.]
MEVLRKIKVDESRLRMAVDSHVPLTVLTYTLPHEMEEFMGEVLKAFITRLGGPKSADALVYCLKELTNNAKKANTKRIYFKEKNLNINDAADYAEGMKTFKQDTISNIKYYLERQKEEGLFIKLTLRALDSAMIIEVSNNVDLTVFEYKRIHDKITRAQVYRSVEEGIMELLDDTEGAGLGLAIMMLILRRAGLNEGNYQVSSEDGQTISRLILPYSAFDKSDALVVKDAAVSLIEDLAVKRKTLSEISRILSNPFGRLGDIASVVSSDAAFAANLFRRVNADSEFSSYPCDSISLAIKHAGRQEIWKLLFDLSSQEYSVSDDESADSVWQHSHRVALYAYNLAANLCGVGKKDVFLEQVYVAALFHDVAKIAFGKLPAITSARFEELCGKSQVKTERTLEKYRGFHHAEIGAALAEKWNFSPMIVDAIKFHHAPFSAPGEHQQIAAVVGLSDLLVHYRAGHIFFDQIDKNLLSLVGLKSEGMAKSLCAVVENAGGGIFNK